MHPQLQQIAAEFQNASTHLHRLASAADEDGRWSRRPAPERWSAAECVAHLNLTSEAFLNPLEEGLAAARAMGGGAPKRYRRDPIGWLLWRMTRPGAGPRTSTSAAFVPAPQRDPGELIAEFDRLQKLQLELVEAADGLPLQRVRIRSPFDPRVRYSVYSALTILPAHQHRHLLQAERALEATRG